MPRHQFDPNRRYRGTKPSYQPGVSDIKTVIILSAPGSAEEKAKYPAAGQTGRNLQGLIRILKNANPTYCPYDDIADYRIVNASEKIHYRKKTIRTEAEDAAILLPANLARIARELDDMNVVIALGNKAQLVALHVATGKTLLTGIHPSFKAINPKYKSLKTKRPDRVADRLNQFARDLLSSEKHPPR